jgi:hypothetical protein
MKAVILRATGEPADVLTVTPDAPAPTRGPGELLVRVVASSVNPVEYKTVKGLLPTKVPKVQRGRGEVVGARRGERKARQNPFVFFPTRPPTLLSTLSPSLNPLSQKDLGRRRGRHRRRGRPRLGLPARHGRLCNDRRL